MTEIAWAEGRWTTEPDNVVVSDAGLFVTAKEGSDAWRETAYGFIHDTEHALLAPIEDGRAVEVSFRVDLPEQFDQAGVFLKVDDENWIKARVERSDGEASLGAVVTRRESDWSLSPVPAWVGRVATVRASWTAGAVTIRARVDDDPWRLVRVAPLPAGAQVEAGPFCCAPSRAGLTVHFLSWRVTEGDAALHPDATGAADPT
jgi:regulation of enolase protein 1 (concanavalin A-like superfamily)